MSDVNEINAFSGKINLTLLNDIVEFVVETAATPYQLQKKLYAQCPFLMSESKNGAFQEKYRFLYLGELLERYEQRFGMPIQDRRAIALALGYTKEIATDDMFVGNQRDVFIQSIRQYVNLDVYLTGAMYLLAVDEGDREDLEKILLKMQFKSTEDIIFVVSLFPDFKDALSNYKSSILRLFGSERSISTLGNMQCFNWLITRLQPIIKSMRSKECGILRALCALPTAYIKKDNKHYELLSKNGYSPLEIAYANTLAVLSQTADKVLHPNSIATEKIVVELFQQVFDYEKALDTKVYERLDSIFLGYEQFSVRCYGEKKLIDILKDSRIKNAKTFAWFTKHTHISNRAFSGFDIEDNKWDTLVTDLEAGKYRYLFEENLISADDKARIQNCIDRYNRLTGKDYVQSYYESDGRRQFHLLVKFGIIDLWSTFQNSLDKAGAIAKPKMMAHISLYIYGIRTEEAFQFCKRFFSQYGVEDYKAYFEILPHSNDFASGLMSRQYYKDKTYIELEFERSYLEKRPDDLKMVLLWMQEYLFKYKTELYLPFICAVLKDTRMADLFSSEIGRKMFDLIAGYPHISKNDIADLKQKYWTEAELTAEKEATKAAEERAAKEANAIQEQNIRNDYDKIVNGSVESVLKFIGRYAWGPRSVALRIVAEKLPQILKKKHSKLNSAEICLFIKICTELMGENAITFSEIQQYILQIEEVGKHVEGDSDDI